MSSSKRLQQITSFKHVLKTSEDVLEEKTCYAIDAFNISRQKFARLALGSQATLIIFH